MKIIYLFRHAKSSWDDPELKDFDRPLNKRGMKSAPLMGRVMRDKGVTPDLIISSPSRRTVETVELALSKARIKVETCRYDRRVYMASDSQLLKILKENGSEIDSIMIIGHNPGLEDLLYRLTNCDEHMATASLVCIQCSIACWKDLSDGCGKVRWIIHPKDIEQN